MCCVNICVYVYVMGGGERERCHTKTITTSGMIKISTIKQPLKCQFNKMKVYTNMILNVSYILK